MIGIALDCDFVIFNKTNSDYSIEVNVFTLKSLFWLWYIKFHFYVLESFEKKRDVIENKPALPRCMCIVHNLDVYCFVGCMAHKKRNAKKNEFVMLH